MLVREKLSDSSWARERVFSIGREGKARKRLARSNMSATGALGKVKHLAAVCLMKVRAIM